MASVDDGTCWNCKHYADNHDYEHGTCGRITVDSAYVFLDTHIDPPAQTESVWLAVTHDFGCKLYEYAPYDKRGRHPRRLLKP